MPSARDDGGMEKQERRAIHTNCTRIEFSFLLTRHDTSSHLFFLTCILEFPHMIQMHQDARIFIHAPVMARNGIILTAARGDQ